MPKTQTPLQPSPWRSPTPNPRPSSSLAWNYPPGGTALQAIQASKIAERFPELADEDANKLKMGIFGKQCKADQALRAGDRVEIYRPLIADPKQVRKERAAKGKQTRKGAKALTE